MTTLGQDGRSPNAFRCHDGHLLGFGVEGLQLQRGLLLLRQTQLGQLEVGVRHVLHAHLDVLPERVRGSKVTYQEGGLLSGARLKHSAQEVNTCILQTSLRLHFVLIFQGGSPVAG